MQKKTNKNQIDKKKLSTRQINEHDQQTTTTTINHRQPPAHNQQHQLQEQQQRQSASVLLLTSTSSLSATEPSGASVVNFRTPFSLRMPLTKDDVRIKTIKHYSTTTDLLLFTNVKNKRSQPKVCDKIKAKKSRKQQQKSKEVKINNKFNIFVAANVSSASTSTSVVWCGASYTWAIFVSLKYLHTDVRVVLCDNLKFFLPNFRISFR